MAVAQPNGGTRARAVHWLAGALAACVFTGCDPMGPPVYLGTETCLGCHDGRSAPDVADYVLSSHFAAGVDCEDCHGPGAGHVRLGGRGGAFINNPAEQSFTDSYGSCIQCHADTVGQFVLSDHATAEATRCHDCHEMHDANAQVLPAEDNRLCLFCHAAEEFADDTLVFFDDAEIAAHTFHTNDPLNTGASRCTSCHMPPLQRENRASGSFSHTWRTFEPIESNLAVEAGADIAPPNSCAGIDGCHDGSVPNTPVFDVDNPEVNESLQQVFELRHGKSIAGAIAGWLLESDVP